MTEEYQDCKETVYDLTELRGGNDEARLNNLVDLLTRQSQLYANSIAIMQQELAHYRNHSNKLAALLKLDANFDQPQIPTEIQAKLEQLHSSVSGALSETRKVKEVEVPIFVEREVVVQRRVEVPVEVERVVEVERIIEVERLVEVEKPVCVERFVEIERIVEVPVEVPIYFEKIVQVVKPMYIQRIVEVERTIEVPCSVCYPNPKPSSKKSLK